jgi:hypothetical protein
MKKLLVLTVAGMLAMGAQGRAVFNPEISVILDTFYFTRSGGINEEGDEHGEFPEKGFNLRTLEFFVTAPVDPYFRFTATIPIEEEGHEGAEVEEAFITTTTGGLNWKLGRFRAAFGRLNRVHPHFWDFVNSPEILSELLGDEGLRELGIQVSYPFGGKDYWLMGAEWLQGENEASFGRLPDDAPDVFHLFLEHSRDLRGGLTYLVTTSFVGGSLNQDWNGEQWRGRVDPLMAVTFTLKSAPPARAIYSGWAVQAEWLSRTVNIKPTVLATADIGPPSVIPLTTRTDEGGYAQLVYRFDRRWRAGIRWEDTALDRVFEADSPRGFSVMTDYSPSEFSRIRLQWTLREAGSTTTHDYYLQFQIGVGPHAPHPF